MKPAYSFQNFLLNANIHIGNEMIDSVTLWWIYNTGSFTQSLFGECVSVTQWICDTGNFFQSLFDRFVTTIMLLKSLFGKFVTPIVLLKSLFCEFVTLEFSLSRPLANAPCLPKRPCTVGGIWKMGEVFINGCIHSVWIWRADNKDDIKASIDEDDSAKKKISKRFTKKW